MKVLEAENIYFTYPEGTQALQGVSLDMEKGEFAALLGPNGCGKTTLFQNLNGLLKPGSGEVRLHGQSLKNKKVEEIFPRIGLVFQDPNDQLFAPTVYEEVSFAPSNQGLSRIVTEERVRRALEALDAWELRAKRINTLSYGQKKRICIAGVLAMEPEVLLLDEPSAGLDPQGSHNLIEILMTYRQATGCSILISTHDVELVAGYCSRAWVMNQGRVVATGSPGDIFNQAHCLEEASLRIPLIGELFQRLAQSGLLVTEILPLTVAAGFQELRTALTLDLTEGSHNKKQAG
ncbi:MAG: energy-coupling factor ABC transporter ATP-binding protein [Bacillota bacterium]